MILYDNVLHCISATQSPRGASLLPSVRRRWACDAIFTRRGSAPVASQDVLGRTKKGVSKPAVDLFSKCPSIHISKLLREKHHCPKQEGILLSKTNRGKLQTEAAALGSRALRPWLQYTARRPPPGRPPAQVRKGGRRGQKRSSSSRFSIRACRVGPLI